MKHHAPCLRICPHNRLIVFGALVVDMFEVYLLYCYKYLLIVFRALKVDMAEGTNRVTKAVLACAALRSYTSSSSCPGSTYA
jgi:hypothetical protein